MAKTKENIVEELKKLEVEFDENDTAKNLAELLKKTKEENPEETPEPPEKPKGKKEKKARYISKGLNLRIVRKSSYTKEVNGKIIVMKGSAIQFKQGLYETDDPEEIKFLDNHADCGGFFIKVEAKDLAKARSEKFKDLETKKAELEAKEKELERKEKALKEGSSLSEKKGKESKSKKEEPKF